MEKADLLQLPILALDESSIDGTINIIKNYLQRLGLEDEVVRDKKNHVQKSFLGRSQHHQDDLPAPCGGCSYPQISIYRADCWIPLDTDERAEAFLVRRLGQTR